MSTSAGKAIWQLAFQNSPIILTGGLAQGIPGVMLPLMALTEAINFPAGLLAGGDNIGMDGFFASFEPIGGTLINQQIGRYPFANQGVAANATIQEPLHVSIRMVTPAKGNLGYFLKLAIMEALQATLSFHNAQGGTYIVMTPSYIFANCILKSLREASSGITKQPQNAWVFDFEQPLLTLNDIESAQNSLLGKISNSLQITGEPAWSGIASAGASTVGLAGPGLSPPLTSSAAGSIITTQLPDLTPGGGIMNVSP